MSFSPNMYLSRVLKKYDPKSMSAYSTSLTEIRGVLQKWAGACFIEVLDSGSRAKGTAISLASDVDYLVSLKRGCNDNNGGLKGCYDSLYAWLSKRYVSVRKQNVSIRISLNGMEVDITPARKQRECGEEHSLYTSKNDSWVQTNIQKHIRDIMGSGRVSEIKILKIWRELCCLEFPSVYLEYLIIESILFGKPKGMDALANNVLHILTELAKPACSNPLYRMVIDPANSNNVLSDLLTDMEKKKVILQAQTSLRATDWGQIVW